MPVHSQSVRKGSAFRQPNVSFRDETCKKKRCVFIPCWRRIRASLLLNPFETFDWASFPACCSRLCAYTLFRHVDRLVKVSAAVIIFSSKHVLTDFMTKLTVLRAQMKTGWLNTRTPLIVLLLQEQALKVAISAKTVILLFTIRAGSIVSSKEIIGCHF